MGNNVVPDLRFKNFIDAWEQRKLSEATNSIVAGGDVDKSKISADGKYPVIANALTNEGIVGYYDDSYRIKAPAVTVTGRGDIGVAKARFTDFTPVVRLLAVSSDHDAVFLENAINNTRIISESTGVPQLTVPQLGNYVISFPKELEEEQKIGSLLSSIDNTIALYQRRYDKLLEIKKSCLEKMFPKNGRDVPEVRFAGFAEAWEQRKFNEFISLRMGHLFSPSDYAVDGRYNVVTISNVKGERFIDVTGMNQINDLPENINEYQILKDGDLLISLTGNIGRVSYNLGDNNILNYRVGKIEFNKLKIDDKYVYAFLCRDSVIKGFIDKGQGGAQPNISKPEIENLSILVPSELEQIKIGRYFENLDNLISLHQRKLEKLKNIKKACLEKMFVE